MRVHVCIPHYAREETDAAANPHGYGSLRVGSQFQRCLALSRCLHGLLGLQRQAEMTVLNIQHKRIDRFPTNQPSLELNISVCSDGEHQLNNVLDLFGQRIQRVELQTDDPRQLPLACRDHLINNASGADLLMYLEDDLVIHDPAFFDKQRWFLDKTEHRFCLMPHRYEPVHQGAINQLLVDGPLSPQFIGRFMQPQCDAAQGLYRGQEEVHFDLTSNPHSGCFVVSAQQAEELSQQELPREGFVGPLETAATLTVLHRYPVMKPSLEHWHFLQLEHGHPSFRSYLNSWPHQDQPVAQQKTDDQELKES
tara:strand:- start:81 stop:1007 length:927 start_codon:yes stop_codon:yes gene_type:complete